MVPSTSICMYYCKSNASFDVCKSVKPYITRSLKKDVEVCIIYVHPSPTIYFLIHISHLIVLPISTADVDL